MTLPQMLPGTQSLKDGQMFSQMQLSCSSVHNSVRSSAVELQQFGAGRSPQKRQSSLQFVPDVPERRNQESKTSYGKKLTVFPTVRFSPFQFNSVRQG